MRKITLTGAVLVAMSIALVGCSQPAGSEAPMDESSMSEAPMSDESMSEEPMDDESMDESMDDESMDDESMDDESMSEESMDEDSMTDMSLSGSFEGLNDKAVTGMVTIAGDTLELSGFASDEGPDLHIYLTNGTDAAAVEAGMRIDAVAWDQESQTFMLEGVDASQYTDVVIHCDKAKAVFGAAPIA